MPTIPPPSSGDVRGLLNYDDSNPKQQEGLPDASRQPDIRSGAPGDRATDGLMARSRISQLTQHSSPKGHPAPSLEAIRAGAATLKPGEQGAAVAHIQLELKLNPIGNYDRS
jgi:hypothetical protein